MKINQHLQRYDNTCKNLQYVLETKEIFDKMEVQEEEESMMKKLGRYFRQYLNMIKRYLSQLFANEEETPKYISKDIYQIYPRIFVYVKEKQCQDKIRSLIAAGKIIYQKNIQRQYLKILKIKQKYQSEDKNKKQRCWDSIVDKSSPRNTQQQQNNIINNIICSSQNVSKMQANQDSSFAALQFTERRKQQQKKLANEKIEKMILKITKQHQKKKENKYNKMKLHRSYKRQSINYEYSHFSKDISSFQDANVSIQKQKQEEENLSEQHNWAGKVACLQIRKMKRQNYLLRNLTRGKQRSRTRENKGKQIYR